MFDAEVMDVIAKVDALREQVDDHWQVPADEAVLLAVLVQMRGAKRIIEIGTSYGFSTLHLAAAAKKLGGCVHSIDIDSRKTEHAAQHLQQAGLANLVTLHNGDAAELLRGESANIWGPFDFAFIDAVKDQSFDYLNALQPHLSPRAAIVTDNTGTHRNELQSFVNHLRELSGGCSADVPVGNGFELTVLE